MFRRRFARCLPISAESSWSADSPLNTDKSIPAQKWRPVDDNTITPRPTGVGDLVHDGGQLRPELGDHGVELFATAEPHMRYAVRLLDLETPVAHRGSVLRGG